MKVQNYGSNQTLIEDAGIAVFYSYETPVVLLVPNTGNDQESRCFITDKKWSCTTSKHINKFLHGLGLDKNDETDVTYVPQDVLDDWRTHEFTKENYDRIRQD